MAAKPRRQLRILRSTAAVAQAGTVNSQGAPCYGWEVVQIFARIPGAGGGTITVQQKVRSSTTYVTTDTFTIAAAGMISDVAIITGEHVRCVFTEGGTVGGQTPEIIIWMS